MANFILATLKISTKDCKHIKNTCLANSDEKKLSSADITTGIDRGKWIRIKRTKTKSLSSIPLLPVAKS